MQAFNVHEWNSLRLSSLGIPEWYKICSQDDQIIFSCKIRQFNIFQYHSNANKSEFICEYVFSWKNISGTFQIEFLWYTYGSYTWNWRIKGKKSHCYKVQMSPYSVITL